MALQKLYLVCVIAQGNPAEAFAGFTVARSTEQVKEIIRRHEPRRRLTTFINEVTGNPNVARDCVATFLTANFEWLDPRPYQDLTHGPTPVPELVVRLMTQDLAC